MQELMRFNNDTLVLDQYYNKKDINRYKETKL